MKRLLILTLVLCCCWSLSLAQDLTMYKQVDTTKLYIETLYPPKMDKAENYPAMVFYFGGGWSGGDRNHFRHHAEYFSQRGLVCFLVDYRTKKNSGTTPFESVKDAKSAMRFIRKYASKFHIDPEKIIASGGSAGGHLAATTALINHFNEETDDLNVSCVPNALVLFNPVFDNGPAGFGYERIGEEYPKFSPLHNIRKGAPPTIVFLGTKDKLIPVETAQYYKVAMEKVGSRCDLFLYEDQTHGFFNYDKFDNYKNTVSKADQFLQSLGYLKEEPIIKIE